MPQKIRGRVMTQGYRRGDDLADWTVPIYQHNIGETAWSAEWVYADGAVIRRYTKTGATKAAATPSSGTDGYVMGIGS